jgi:hypothetical protein
MTDKVITLKISDETQRELEELAEKLGYSDVDAFIETLQPEFQELLQESMRMQLEAIDERRWDEQFEHSQDVLDLLAEEIRQERASGRTVPLDPETDLDEA